MSVYLEEYSIRIHS